MLTLSIYTVHVLQKPALPHYKLKKPVSKSPLPRHCPFTKLKLKRKYVIETVMSLHHTINPKDSDTSNRTVSIPPPPPAFNTEIKCGGICPQNSYIWMQLLKENRDNRGNSSIFRMVTFLKSNREYEISHIYSYTFPSLTHIDKLVFLTCFLKSTGLFKVHIK